MWIEARFRADLAERYNVPGPRYTSYPTANHFTESFTAADYVECAKRSNEDPIPRPLSLYLHVPFCSNPCFYCGCTRLITRSRAQADAYLRRLLKEVELLAPQFDRDREVRQLHFGGGTPTFLDDEQMARVLAALRAHFNFAADGGEFAIEIDPRTVDPDRLRSLAALGCNRASFGVQDFDPEVQHAVNRVQSLAQTAEVMAAARAVGFRSLNVDLIYGLPKQTRDGFARTLAAVIELRPERIAAYSYAHLPTVFKPQRQIREADLPSPGAKLELLQLTVERLCAAGYRYIGMDHFALPEDELARAAEQGRLRRNFQGYSVCAECDIVGLGLSAISAVGDSYSQNHKQLDRYYQALDQGRLPVARGWRLSGEDVLRRDLIERLLCDGRVDFAAFERSHGICFNEHFATELRRLEPLIRDGLLRADGAGLRLTAEGRLLMRAPAMVFDAYLHGAAQVIPTPSRFSRIV